MISRSKLRKNNQGMSLIEVIVSMIILAIIAVPLLNSFGISANINNKTRVRQYATVLAQNIMEGIKNTDLEDVAVAMNEVVSGGGLKIVPASAMPATTTHGVTYYETTVDSANPVLAASSCSFTYEAGSKIFKENLAKKYYYILKEVTEGTKKFDVKIEYDGSGFVATPGAIVKQNNYEAPNVSDFDMNTTALINPNGALMTFATNALGEYVLDPMNHDFYSIASTLTYDDRAVSYFFQLHLLTNPFANASSTVPLIRDGLTRLTELTISDKPGGLKVNCKYTYEYDPSGRPAVSTTGTSITVKEFPDAYNVEFGPYLKDIYLFHIPLQYDKWNGHEADKVLIKNLSSSTTDFNIFIAEQPIGNSYTNSETVYVNAVNNAGASCNNINFYYAKPGSSVFLEEYDTYNIDGTRAFNKLVQNLEVQPRIYQVTVSIYPHGSSEVLYQLQSTTTK